MKSPGNAITLSEMAIVIGKLSDILKTMSVQASEKHRVSIDELGKELYKIHKSAVRVSNTSDIDYSAWLDENGLTRIGGACPREILTDQDIDKIKNLGLF